MAEVAYLKEVFGRRSEASIARELGRPVESVLRMAKQVFRGPRRQGAFTEEELELLRECLGATELDNVALVLSRSPADVESALATFDNFTKKGRWDQEEIARLKRLYGSRRDEDLARIFGRSEAAIRRQANKLCLAKDKTFLRRLHDGPASRMPRWSRDEVELLVELYRTASNLEIAERLGRSVKSVVSKAHELALRKGTERLQEMGRDNVALRADRKH